MRKLRFALITFWLILNDKPHYFYSKNYSHGNLSRDESFDIRGEMIDIFEDKKMLKGSRLRTSREQPEPYKQAA